MTLRTGLVLAAAAMASGCISISSFQTARTQRKGEFSGFFGLGYESLVFPKKTGTAEEKDAQEAVEEVKVPIVETGFRYGLCGDCDIGARFTLPGTIAGEFKYQLTGDDDSLATAIGIGLGRGTYESESENFKSTYEITDVFVPFWVSKDITDTFGVYLSPRVLMRSTTFTTEDTKSDFDTGAETTEETTEKDSATFVGATVGLNWYWFVAEAGYFSVPGGQTQAGIAQVMIGYWGGWDEVDRPAAKPKKEPRKKKRKKTEET